MYSFMNLIYRRSHEPDGEHDMAYLAVQVGFTERFN